MSQLLAVGPHPVDDRRVSPQTLTPAPAGLDAGLMGLRVIFAEDNYLVRAGTAALLGEAADLELVALVGNATELLAAVAEHRPDAVLTDIRMPPSWTSEGIDAARRIRQEYPGVGVVVLSQYVEGRYAAELLADGAGGIGYLLKERIADLDQLTSALATVAAGGSVLDPKVVESLVARRRAVGQSQVAQLSPRELEVLQAMATGKSNQAIGRELYLSERAVEKNINQIFGKLGLSQELDVNRRVRAVVTFLETTRS
jgi:DNA-binding NarL/FixJ family response regulator